MASFGNTINGADIASSGSTDTDREAKNTGHEANDAGHETNGTGHETNDSKRPSTQPRNDAMNAFISHFGDFVTALGEVFPEKTILIETVLKFKMGIEMEADYDTKSNNMKMIMSSFDSSTSPYYSRILKRDSTVFDDLNKETPQGGEGVNYATVFANLFCEADAECKDTMWQFLILLTQHAIAYKMYENMPPSLGSAISDLTDQVSNGSVDASNLNLVEVSKILLSKVDKDQMDKFAETLMSDPTKINDMFNVVMSSGLADTSELVGSSDSNGATTK